MRYVDVVVPQELKLGASISDRREHGDAAAAPTAEDGWPLWSLKRKDFRGRQAGNRITVRPVKNAPHCVQSEISMDCVSAVVETLNIGTDEGQVPVNRLHAAIQADITHRDATLMQAVLAIHAESPGGPLHVDFVST